MNNLKIGQIVTSCYSGDAVIIAEEKPGFYKIQFIETKNEYVFQKAHILKGKFVDSIKKEQEFCSKLYPQHCGDSLRIIKKSDYKKEGRREPYYDCEFINYPYRVIKPQTSILRGECQNYNIPDKFGFVLGEPPIKEEKYIFDKWRALKRCYDNKLNNHRFYKDSIVSDGTNGFKYYPNFKKWYIENSKWNINNYKLELDKDVLFNIKHLNQKIYSLETCLLIPDVLNNFLSGDNVNTGVHLSKSGRIFEVIYEGVYKGFDTFKKAKGYYAKIKYKRWIELINQFSLPSELKEILYKYDFTWYWLQ